MSSTVNSTVWVLTGTKRVKNINSRPIPGFLSAGLRVCYTWPIALLTHSMRDTVFVVCVCVCWKEHACTHTYRIENMIPPDSCPHYHVALYDIIDLLPDSTGASSANEPALYLRDIQYRARNTKQSNKKGKLIFTGVHDILPGAVNTEESEGRTHSLPRNPAYFGAYFSCGIYCRRAWGSSVGRRPSFDIQP